MFYPGQDKPPIRQSPVFGGILAVCLALVILCFVVREINLLVLASLGGLILISAYFLGHFDKAYLPFVIVVILPLALFITAIPDLRAFELVIPGLFILLVLRQAVLGDARTGTRVVPGAMLIFFGMGLASYLRHPSLPAQVFARVRDFGNFRTYWNFFLGLMSYILAFHLFRRETDRKILVLVKLMTMIFVSGLILQLAAPVLPFNIPVGSILVHWGPVTDGVQAGEAVFRGWAVGWLGLFLFFILISFPEIPKSREIKLIISLLALAGIILSGARSILLAALVAAIVFCVLKRKTLRLLIPLAALVALLAVSYFYPGLIDSLPEGTQRVFTIFPTAGQGHAHAVGSARIRIAWWTEALDVISNHPLTGIGFEKIGEEAYYLHYADYAVRIGASHNAYIATGVMIGLPGMVVLIWIFLVHIRRGFVLARASFRPREEQINTWLVLMVLGFNIVFFFAGSPHHLYQYFFYAGLINLKWHLAAGQDLKDVPPGLSASSKAGPGIPSGQPGSGRKGCLKQQVPE